MSTTPRRSARLSNLPPSPTTSAASTSKAPAEKESPTQLAARRLPYLPTTLETLLLAIYPTTLLAGSLFGLLDPSSRASTYNPVTQSHYAATAPSYFATKGNIFNRFFVKQGWAWITFSYLFFLFTHPSGGALGSITPKRIRGLVRYGMVTVWWIFVTQWFFGPGIIDRGFTLTGGQCELMEATDTGHIAMDHTRRFVTSVACKAGGGKWQGGHDISGHVFLLVLGSMFLFEEVLYVVLKSSQSREERSIVMGDGAVKSAEVEAEVEAAICGPGQWTLGSKIALGVGALSVYMLLMTAAYFHTWFEKFTGLLVSLVGIFSVYFLPRMVPALRNIVGMPGV